ncbi:unnamed protein product [Paramecium octaurelia]|uniref:Uncharacterized protein n=1 Tax=Paramecium octaurelia TaxID=43137 RepID=A0A8S1WX44_PAROT|nr:unnamed protein product [Paramecium octaurelia]
MNPLNIQSENKDSEVKEDEGVQNEQEEPRTFTNLSIEDKIKQKKINDDHLERNKKRLIRQFTILFIITLFIILERILYSIIVGVENELLSDFQSLFNLRKSKLTEFDEMDYFNDNFLFDMAGSVHRNGISIMIFTNYFITLYVGFDALIAVKILYTSYLSVFLVAFLQLIYSDPRPFWMDEKLVTSLCIPSYGNPSSFVCQLAFTLFYTVYCYKTKNHTRSFKTYDEKIDRKIKIVQLFIALFIFLYSILLFLMALQYLINMILGLIYCFVFYAFYVTFENQINNIIKHSTIMNIDSKRYVFYISFFLLITETIAAMLISNEYELVNIEWANNFMNCLYMTDINAMKIPAQLLMGPHFTFQKTSVIFALIGALFGVSHCFRHINSLEWYKGDKRRRVLRIIVANLFTIPGWIFALNVESIALNSRMYEWGASFFLMESVAFLLFYFFMFALIPLYVFKYLHLNASSSSSYVVVKLSEDD